MKIAKVRDAKIKGLWVSPGVERKLNLIKGHEHFRSSEAAMWYQNPKKELWKNNLLQQQTFVYSSSTWSSYSTAGTSWAKSPASKYLRTAIWCLFYHAQLNTQVGQWCSEYHFASNPWSFLLRLYSSVASTADQRQVTWTVLKLGYVSSTNKNNWHFIKIP